MTGATTGRPVACWPAGGGYVHPHASPQRTLGSLDARRATEPTPCEGETRSSELPACGGMTSRADARYLEESGTSANGNAGGDHRSGAAAPVSPQTIKLGKGGCPACWSYRQSVTSSCGLQEFHQHTLVVVDEREAASAAVGNLTGRRHNSDSLFFQGCDGLIEVVHLDGKVVDPANLQVVSARRRSSTISFASSFWKSSSLSEPRPIKATCTPGQPKVYNCSKPRCSTYHAVLASKFSTTTPT